MTGSLSVVERGYAMSSIFILVGELELLRIMFPSTWTYGQHWITGRVSK